MPEVHGVQEGMQGQDAGDHPALVRVISGDSCRPAPGECAILCHLQSRRRLDHQTTPLVTAATRQDDAAADEGRRRRSCDCRHVDECVGLSHRVGYARSGAYSPLHFCRGTREIRIISGRPPWRRASEVFLAAQGDRRGGGGKAVGAAFGQRAGGCKLGYWGQGGGTRREYRPGPAILSARSRSDTTMQCHSDGARRC